MISRKQELRILELLAAGELPHRQIAAQTGVSKGTVDRLAVEGHPRERKEPGESWRGPDKDGNIDSLPVADHICPGCSNTVVLYPCRICVARQWRAINAADSRESVT